MTVNDPGSGGWDSLAPWEQARQWYAVAPEISGDLRILASRQLAHQQSMDTKYYRLQLLMVLSSFVVAGLLAAAAWRAAVHGADGAIIATAASSAVASSVGGIAGIGRSLFHNNKT